MRQPYLSAALPVAGSIDGVAVCVNCSIRCVEVGECGDLQIGSIAGDGSAHNADERKGDHAVQQERAQVVSGLKQDPKSGATAATMIYTPNRIIHVV